MSDNPVTERMSAEAEAESAVLAAPLGGTRQQAVQRLQIGLIGLATMTLVVAMANIIMERAKESDASTVPEAAATMAADPAMTAPASDPLSDAGVVPELPQNVPSAATPNASGNPATPEGQGGAPLNGEGNANSAQSQ